jgi:Predicted aminoglycoside phosphotransferase
MPSAPRMHADEVEIDAARVSRLLAAQFPQWADLPVRPVRSAGTDHALFRIGNDLAARLPRIPWAVGQAEKEARWLPRLAPHLPLAVPTPLALGAPGEGYPWSWSVCPWLPGENVTPDRLPDPVQAAEDLARFVTALRALPAADGPASGAHNFFRGVPLAERDPHTRKALAELAALPDGGGIDVAAASAAWDAALRVPPWNRPPVRVHGDLQSGNLLAQHGRLTAVIDWGGLGVGDPAVDLIVAWNLFPEDARTAYRTALGTDDATWARGRGWALSIALVALPYYLHTNPPLVAMSRRTIGAVLSEPAP